MMLERVVGEDARREFGASSVLEVGLVQSNPHEGARLIRAFLRISDPEMRSAIVHMIETIGSAPRD
jgi:hypothetical protein